MRIDILVSLEVLIKCEAHLRSHMKTCHVEANDWSKVRLVEWTSREKWHPIEAPIGLSNSWQIQLTNQNSILSNSKRSSGHTKSPIGCVDWSIEHMGLTPIRSDPSIGPTKSQPKWSSGHTKSPIRHQSINWAYGTHSDPIGSVNWAYKVSALISLTLKLICTRVGALSKMSFEYHALAP
jgi:hypothetical protein